MIFNDLDDKRCDYLIAEECICNSLLEYDDWITTLQQEYAMQKLMDEQDNWLEAQGLGDI